MRISAKYAEQFYTRYQPREYRDTLHYYNQAANLVKTLPPAGSYNLYNYLKEKRAPGETVLEICTKK